MTRPVVIDLSRLVWRGRHATPSGIDRVERAYARHFLGQSDRPTRFIARMGAAGARHLDPGLLAGFLDRLDAGWSASGKGGGFASALRLLAGSRGVTGGDGAITIIPSHQNWHRLPWLERWRHGNGRLVLFLHDTIPSDFPEYARAGGAARHLGRLRNGLAVADGFIVNSAATESALLRHAKAGHRPEIAIAPIGLDPLPAASRFKVPDDPYFLCLGTIEPRKNHLLLLHVWRQLAARGTAAIPRLVIVGRRGWENENIVDLLERSHAIGDHVSEYNQLGDSDLVALILGARALLMPSFAEGFGMPVVEALALGVPVIASDMAVYRESAGQVPDYLDPLDGPGWSKAVMDYAGPQSHARQAQIERMQGWSPPGWDNHFASVHALLERIER